MVSCCVIQCTNRSRPKQKLLRNITFHLFPKDPHKRKEWAESVHRGRWVPSKTSVVCSEHFEKHCFYKTEKGLVRLFEDAIPSLRIPNFSVKKSKKSNVTKCSVHYHKRKTKDNPILKDPIIEENDSPKTKLLASYIKRMVYLCKKQRKAIRSINNKLRCQEMQLLKHNIVNEK